MANYKAGDLVWAKMKGFPPWPAKILNTASDLSDVPVGRFSVRFFGTNETAIIKGCDLYPYEEYRSQFEVPRKAKSFTVALHAASAAASGKSKEDGARTSSTLAIVTASDANHGGRTRRTSSRLFAEELALPSTSRDRSRSVCSRRSRNNSGSSQKSKSKAKPEQRKGSRTPERRRLDSGGSSSGRRKRTPSGIFDIDHFDASADPMLSPMLSDGAFNCLLEGLEADLEDEPSGKQFKRQSRLRMFDDFISSGKTPPRERANSTSSSCRTRLISGVSDVFEELLESAQSLFNPADLLSAIDNLPSEDDRPVTPEEPLPMPVPTKCCAYCGCECELIGLKWKCSGKSCLKWNGTLDSYSKDGDSAFHGGIKQITDAVDLLDGGSANSHGFSNVKMESPSFDSDGFSVKKDASWLMGDAAEEKSMSSAFSTRQFERDRLLPLSPSPSGTLAAQPAPQIPHSTAPTVSVNVPPTLPRRQLGSGRPKSYKVEKTPPVTENGQRHCAFCGGQVRPQMCGGNKHRWRCVDKKCRKWYGWVRSNEEIPKDLGKKGRWKDLALKIKRKGSSGGDGDGEDVSNTSGATAVPHSQNAYIAAALPLCEKQPKKLGRPPKGQGKVKLKVKRKLGDSSECDVVVDGERPKRKYTKKDAKVKEESPSITRSSPLPPEVLLWQPCAMERRARWWISEKRKHDVSPEREWDPHSLLDCAAAFRVVGNSMKAAANTRSDEPASISGTLDLLMDTLMASLGPLLSMVTHIPGVTVNSVILQKIRNASAVHTPMFT